MLPDLPQPGFVELGAADGLLVDLRYASANNFVRRNVYGAFDRLLLHPIAADKLRAAVALLAESRPALRLLVFDGLRPNRVQRVFWSLVQGTPLQRYVGDPAVGSVHGYGLAVDVSLATSDGAELDMGTPFDDFTPLAEPQLEAQHREAGALSAAQLANRQLLRGVMSAAGFLPIPVEWWHFDALPSAEVRARYPLIE